MVIWRAGWAAMCTICRLRGDQNLQMSGWRWHPGSLSDLAKVTQRALTESAVVPHSLMTSVHT